MTTTEESIEESHLRRQFFACFRAFCADKHGIYDEQEAERAWQHFLFDYRAGFPSLFPSQET
jgi:hypothetical protein